MKFLAAILFLFVLTGCIGTFNNGVALYAGGDYTSGVSSYCTPNGCGESNGIRTNERIVSNLGLIYNIWQSDNEYVEINGKYTHHSCFWNPDADIYDAGGLELKVWLWKK